MLQDYKVEGFTKNTTGSNHIYTQSRDQALHYARTMLGSGKWENVVIWKDGKEYMSHSWNHMP